MSELAVTAFLNGQLIPVSEATIPASDHGFLYGTGLFETIKIIDGEPVFLKQHLERLWKGARVLGLEPPLKTSLTAGISACIQSNGIDTGYIRLIVSRGPGDHSWKIESCKESTVLIVAHRGLPYIPDLYLQGFRAVTATFPRNQHSPLTRIKSLNYTENILAKIEANRQGVEESLFLNTLGQVTECTMSNIFLVTAKKLVTPSPSSGLLPGIVRQQLLELAAAAGLEAIETTINRSDLLVADEVFISNSLLGLMPLRSLDGQRLGSAIPGPLTLRLTDLLATREKES